MTKQPLTLYLGYYLLLCQLHFFFTIMLYVCRCLQVTSLSGRTTTDVTLYLNLPFYFSAI